MAFNAIYILSNHVFLIVSTRERSVKVNVITESASPGSLKENLTINKIFKQEAQYSTTAIRQKLNLQTAPPPDGNVFRPINMA